MIIVRTPGELQRFIKAAAQGKIGFLLVTGHGGVGKTYSIKKGLKESNHLMLSSHLTPASLYEQLFEHRHEPIFVNDIDKLFNNHTMLALMKQCTETEDEKVVQYNSKTPLMADLPRSFTTTSTMIVDANALPQGKNKDFAALLTRGVHIDYQPTNETLLDIMRFFSKEPTILDWFEKHKDFPLRYDLRKIIVAEQLKKSGLCWEDYLTQEFNMDNELIVVQKIGFDKPYAERCEEWRKFTDKSIRSYDRALKRYKKKPKHLHDELKKQTRRDSNNTRSHP